MAKRIWKIKKTGDNCFKGYSGNILVYPLEFFTTEIENML